MDDKIVAPSSSDRRAHTPERCRKCVDGKSRGEPGSASGRADRRRKVASRATSGDGRHGTSDKEDEISGRRRSRAGRSRGGARSPRAGRSICRRTSAGPLRQRPPDRIRSTTWGRSGHSCGHAALDPTPQARLCLPWYPETHNLTPLIMEWPLFIEWDEIRLRGGRPPEMRYATPPCVGSRRDCSLTKWVESPPPRRAWRRHRPACSSGCLSGWAR